jgi:hypothetical protein
MDRGFSRDFNPLGPAGGGEVSRDEVIEVAGPFLRLRGRVSLARFNRLSDMINHNQGFLKLSAAHLLRRNGEESDLVIPELMVNQDEITFIAQEKPAAPSPQSSEAGGFGRPTMNRAPRQIVLFTPAFTISGSVYIFGETTIEAVVDTSDPRFVPMINVTTRSLADRRLVSHYEFALVNRTQVTAASFLETSGGAAETGVAVE